MIEPSIADHLFFLIVGLCLPISNFFRAREGFGDMQFDTATRIQIYYSNGLVLWLGAFIALGLWWMQDRSFILLGLQVPELNRITIGLSLGFILWYGFDLFRETQFAERRKKTIARWHQYTPFMPTNKEELSHFNFLAVSAGIGEEIVFRGFFIIYLTSVFYNVPQGENLAVIIPALIFAVGHSYQGIRAVFKIFFLAILFGYLFLFSNSLWIVILLHIFLDMVSGWVTMKLVTNEDQS